MSVGILAGLKLIGGLVTQPIKDYGERKKIKLESDKRIQEAVTVSKIKILETGQAADIKWENLSIQNAGWKDELWTIILAIPAVLCFHPLGADLVREGFIALSYTPGWYQTLFGVAVGSAFGVRTFTNFKQLMKGN